MHTCRESFEGREEGRNRSNTCSGHQRKMSKHANGSQNVDLEPLRRVPYQKPPFTIGDLKKAIPPHCFKRSILRSFTYVISDLTISFILYHIASTYIHHLPHNLSYIAWPVYWILQGFTLGGVWVIGHECGHHAFSNFQYVDDTVGFILHSSLLVPYFSWKYSHRHHHSNTSSIDRDEVFVPQLKSNVPSSAMYLNNPPGRVLRQLVNHTLGWPMYLMFSYGGRCYDKLACHFDPYSPIFSDGERVHVLVSNVGIIIVTYLLYNLAMVKGLIWVLCIYGGPLIIVNGSLVTVTYLHHTHPSLPRYDSTEWDWLRGALATVDRDYGILNWTGHSIAGTHVVHHLFPTIPHYHAMEATMAIKPILGDYYKFDKTWIFKALYRETKECAYVEYDDSEDAKGVLWFGNKFS